MESEKLYRIKPLKWKNLNHANGAVADGIRGDWYCVYREDAVWLWNFNTNTPNRCDDFEHGRQLAEAHYRETLERSLIEAEADDASVPQKTVEPFITGVKKLGKVI
jgi:hypothetical protein